MLVPITAIYGSLLALVILWLSIRVVSLRRSHKVGLGSGGVEAIEHAMRVQANATEYIPILVLLLAVFELNGGNVTLTHVFGGLVVLFRVMHGIGFSGAKGVSIGRFVGALGTFVMVLVLALINLHGAFFAA